MTSPVVERHDPSRPYAEQYRIDAQQFANLYRLVSPWTCGEHTDVLAQRTFRLLDENMDRLIEFKGLASCLGTGSPLGWEEVGRGGRWYMGKTGMLKCHTTGRGGCGQMVFLGW